jgi:hypothetical protein
MCQTLKLDSEFLQSVFIATEDYLRTSRGQESLYVLDLAFPKSRPGDYHSIIDLLYAEMCPWGRREALAYYAGKGPLLIAMYAMPELGVIDLMMKRFLEELQHMYERFLMLGWQLNKRPRTLMREVRGTLAVFKPRMPKPKRIAIGDQEEVAA